MKRRYFAVAVCIAVLLGGCAACTSCRRAPATQWTTLPGAKHPAVRSLVRVDLSHGGGSAIVIHVDRKYALAVTAGHVLQHAINPKIRTYWPIVQEARANVVTWTANLDLGLIEWDITKWRSRPVAATLGQQADCWIGRHVVAVGVPGGFVPYWSHGQIHGLDGGMFGGWMILSSARVVSGMSGGGLFTDDYGRLLGVLSRMAAVGHAMFRYPEGEMAGVVPCWVARKWLAEQGVYK